MKNNVVKIRIWNKTVGYIYWDKMKKTSVFQYDDDFISSGWDIAHFIMSIHNTRSRKGLPWLGNTDKFYQGLPAMIADSLPDKWGNSIFTTWLRDNKIKTSNVTPIDKLSFIGSRAMGALEFEPAQNLGSNNAFDIDVQKLYEFAQNVLDSRDAITLTEENSILWHDLIKVGGSPGGRRPKAIVAINEKTNEIKSGQSDAPEGFTHYLLKYDDNSSFPYAKIEYIYYLMATQAGIEMMPSFLHSYGNATHFLTKRFDRDGNWKVHTQTMAAMMPDSDNYDDLFSIIRRLNLPYKAHEQQYLRMVFNVLARNVDDHSKNFSFCMHQNGQWSLSPAYDVTYSVDNLAPDYLNRHALLINGKDNDITRKDLEEVAKRNDINNYAALIESASSAIANFRLFAKEQNLSEEIIKLIAKELNI